MKLPICKMCNKKILRSQFKKKVGGGGVEKEIYIHTGCGIASIIK